MKDTLKKSNAVTILLVIILIGLTQNSKAASPSSLDSSFGVAGKVVRNLGSNDQIRNIATQKDGKIIAVGANSDDIFSFITMRFTAKGLPDPTFGTNGVVTTSFDPFISHFADSVAIQTDGKIIVAGSLSPSSQCGVVRYNPNGSLDNTFDGDGKLTISNCDSPRDIEVQNDGKIVIASRLTHLIRLNSNGSLDTSFNSTGRVTFTISGCTFIEMFSVEIQEDGKIVTSGIGCSGQKSIIARRNANGSPDVSFNNTGIFLAENFLQLRKVKIEKNSGKIYSCGNKNNFIVLIRLNSNGTLDSSFDFDGVAFIDLGTNTEALGLSLELQSDGQIIVGGNCNGSSCLGNGGSFRNILARFNSQGALDPAFGQSGLHFPKLSNERLNNFKLQGDKLVVSSNQNEDFVLHRFNLSITPSQSGDFDGDGFGDIAVYRPSQGLWIILNSTDNTIRFNQFGLNGDIPIDGDFDGDGRNDLSIYRPSNGLWFVERSSDGTNFARQFGTSSDKPVTDDYDKDGKADLAFFRPASGEWFIVRSSDGFNSFFSFPFGQNGDIPIVKKGA